MTSTVLVALLAVAGLSACEKATVKPPAEVQPVVQKQVAIPGPVVAPVPVHGPTAPSGAATDAGEKVAPDNLGDTVLVLPEKH
jgi:hypothetical protein